MLRAALVYASWGWYVHPLRPGGKRPLLSDWPRRASIDPDQIRRWWGCWPEANIGLACGPSGLLAIDLDVKHGVDGLATWEALQAELGIADVATAGCTPVSNTPGGGRHILFSLGERSPTASGDAAGGRSPGNTAGKLGPGIDTRGDGGYIVLPPSRLLAESPPAGPAAPAEPGSAGTWTWRPEAHPRHCRPLPLPEVLWQRLVEGPPAAGSSRAGGRAMAAADRPAVTTAGTAEAGQPGGAGGARPTGYGKAALVGEARRVAAARLGERNNTLNAAAFALGQLVAAGLLERRQVERPLILAARVAGLGEEEATATARSGLDAGQRLPRQRPVAGRAAARPPAPAQPSTSGPPTASGPPAPPGVPVPADPGDQAGMSELPVNGELLAEGADDEGNAQCVARLYRECFLYCTAYGWMQYAGSHWVRDVKGLAVSRAIIDTLKLRHQLALQGERVTIAKVTSRSSYRVKAARELLPSLLCADAETFDASPDHLNVANGVLDLRTGTLAPHHPDQRYTYCLEVAYDPGTDYRPWQDWLRQALAAETPTIAGHEAPAQPSSAQPGEAEEFYLQLAVGYSLTGHTSEEVLFYLYGPPRSGKGTFTEALLRLMGPEPLAAEVHFGTFVRSRRNDSNSADLAGLKPCRLVVASEPSQDDWLQAAELKRLTGGNLIYAAFKFRDHFTYRPAFKIWLSGNHPPRADVDDDAIWSRLRVIPFPNSYLGREDRNLKARMKAPEMQRQILAWAVDGARAWYSTIPHGLPTPPSIEGATRAARDELDHVGQWLAECVAVTGAEDDFVPNRALHASYEAWSQQVGAPDRSVTRLTQALRARGLAAGTQRWHGGKNERGCRAIRLLR